MNTDQLSEEHLDLIQSVQHNCHISDARHAGDYTLCVYLLKMREFYRWEQHKSFNTELSTDDIGEWLTQREEHWDSLEDASYIELDVEGEKIDPFEAETVNRSLIDDGLVYSGGIGQKAKPHFFIGKLETKKQVGDYNIYITAEEYARDLTSPPAMSLDRSIFIRRESFRRMIWERIEEWRWNRPDNAMAKAISYYDFDGDLTTSLESMTDDELESTILHEIGEIRAGEQLPGWSDMMNDIVFTPAEIMARAVRDHLADALSTLPQLIESDNEASIHFYFSNLTAMRKKIFPKLMNAYVKWNEDGDIKPLTSSIRDSREHWSDVADQLLNFYASDKTNASQLIEDYVDAHHL